MSVYFINSTQREKERARYHYGYMIFVHVYVHGTEYPNNMGTYSFGLRFQALPSTKASSTTLDPSLCSTSPPLPTPKKSKEKHTSYHAQTGPVLWVCYTPAPAHTRPALGWVRSPQGRAQHAGHRHFAGSVPSRYFPYAPDRDANFDEVFAGLYGDAKEVGFNFDSHLQKQKCNEICY